MAETDWTVTVEARKGPDDRALTEDEAHGAAGIIESLVASIHPAVAVGLDQWTVAVTTPARNWLDAANSAIGVLDLAAHHARIPSEWPIVRVEAHRTDLRDADLDQTNFPDLVGVLEVAAMLGVSKQRFSQLRLSGRFPEPITQLAATPVWLRSTVDAFLEGWDRRAGRRPRPRVAPGDEDLVIDTFTVDDDDLVAVKEPGGGRVSSQ